MVFNSVGKPLVPNPAQAIPSNATVRINSRSSKSPRTSCKRSVFDFKRTQNLSRITMMKKNFCKNYLIKTFQGIT